MITIPNDSPFWQILKVVLRGAMLLLALYMFYNTLDPRDIKTLILMLVSDAGLEAAGNIKSSVPVPEITHDT